ncbi:DUF1254 domain-containing protein [Pseudomonas nitroreducens]|uniref:DUF1254 domain-containing protein n=1 Tax=Pseudomonas nitroreducens TaxID=46680 RepID=A0A5R8ZTC5_PSENT|nr:DUF1254 domain-containing protein [Pseudomonas nitroreducens]TLP68626.1 DUF1254 domain-containing protein [Pseudomonas nitroreducens]
MRHWLPALAILPLFAGHAWAAAPTAQQARDLAEQAYLFSFATAEHGKTLQAIAAKLPVNYLYNRSTLLGPEDRTVVSPNNDTLYSYALLDLREHPVILEVPAVPQRYYSFQLIDMRTDNLEYIGTRATGRAAGSFLIAGPDWDGKTPDDFHGKVIRSPSRILFLLGRTAVDGEADIDAAKAVLDGYKLRSTKPTLLPHKLDVPPYQPTKEGPAQNAFVDFNALSAWHAWNPQEQERLAQFAQIGVGTGKSFDPAQLPADIAQAVAQGAEDGRNKVLAATEGFSKPSNGWQKFPANIGHYGGDDLTRAAVAWKYLYANDAVEAMYPVTHVDADGQPLDGKRSYRLHFAPGQLPPVDAFWSVTLYDGKTQMLSANPLNRYTLNSEGGLKQDADGGLTLSIQHEQPATTANWLPAPQGPFNLILRMYLPQEKALKGDYQPPAVQPVNSQE